MSLAFPLSDAQASLSALYWASASLFAIVYPSFDSGAEAAFGAVICAEPGPTTPSPAVRNTASISLFNLFPQIQLRNKRRVQKPKADGPKTKDRKPKAKRHDGIFHGLRAHRI